jgi:hypothetical protein
LRAFALGEALALALGVAGIIRVKAGAEKTGVPEALLGIGAVCIFVVIALTFLLSTVAPAQAAG